MPAEDGEAEQGFHEDPGSQGGAFWAVVISVDI